MVPFTTPLLGGTRARPAEKRNLELVVPNPSGGRGVYIMPWTSIGAVCRPTLHDKLLNSRVATVSSVTPSTIRRVAREIAAEGLAGEAAMEAAQVAEDTDKGDRLTTNYLLLMNLIDLVNAGSSARPSTRGPDPAELEKRARQTIAQIAPTLGQSTHWVATALETIADIMAQVGLGAGPATGRVPRLISLLHRARTDIAGWSRTQREDDQASYARMVCLVADHTLTMAETTLAKAQALTTDMMGLLRTWSTDSVSIVRLVERPEWLLDGWEQICLIWNYAQDDAARRAALVEIVGLVPVLPREASEWCEPTAKDREPVRFHRLVNLNEDWRTGATVFDLIARNEHIRSLAC